MIQTFRFDGPVKIVNLGDIHLGSRFADKKLLQKNISRIADDPWTFWLSSGDILENALKSSKSSCYESTNPDMEADEFNRRIAPIRNKCLGFVESNHHARTKDVAGVSLDRLLADRCRIPYLGTTGLIKVVCGRASYFLYIHHGVGGGQTGNKISRAERLSYNVHNADIYLTGHTHSFAYWLDTQTIIDRKRDKTTEILATHVVGAHYIKYTGSYAERYGLKEKPRGSAVVELSANGSGKECNKHVRVDLWGE